MTDTIAEPAGPLDSLLGLTGRYAAERNRLLLVAGEDAFHAVTVDGPALTPAEREEVAEALARLLNGRQG